MLCEAKLMLKEKEKFMGQAVLHYQKNGKSSGVLSVHISTENLEKNTHIATLI